MLIQTTIDQSYSKVYNTIHSCVNKKQLEGALNMINNFKVLYREVGSVTELYYGLVTEYKNKHKELWQ